MADIVDALKAHARILHRRAQSNEPGALARLRKLKELRPLDDASLCSHVKRRHCLAVVAHDLGFESWTHATQVLRGENTSDFGKLLYGPRCGAHFNIWCATYEEGRTIRAQHGGFLLAYRRQCLVVDEHYVRTLGLDPDDPDWRRMGRDWLKPNDPEARGRLYGKLIEASLGLRG